ncbi:MAG TPA: cytochrome c [Candidatus Acidoferrales bacterium]|nr:cytochrome c [Candidatus Acidoferrales bacterium]
MNHVGMFGVIALAAILGTSSGAAQDQGQRIPSSWTTTTVSGQGQPRGYVEYQKYCSACHGAGVGRPGTMALEAKYKGSEPALLDQRTDLTPELVKTYVRNGISIMPFFRKTEISDAELDAIALYLTRNNKP